MEKLKKTRQKNRGTNQINTPIYLGLSAVIILLLVLMFIVTNLNTYMRQSKDNLEVKEYLNLDQGDQVNVIERQDDLSHFNLLAPGQKRIEDSLKQAKISYTVKTSLKDIENTKENLIIDGSMLRDAEDLSILKQIINNKRKIIFLSMPSVDYIKENKLKEILGISKLGGVKKRKHLDLVPGFMLGGLHEFKDIPYESLDVKLLYSAKVYAYDKKKSPTIWRNIYGNSEIYMVNGTFMEGSASYGIMSAIMSEIYEDYIYPVINARFTVYEDFPYISDENREKLEKLYNRGPMRTQYDILMPDILTMAKRRDFIANGYLRVGFKDKSEKYISENSIRQLSNIRSQVYKAGGDIGVRYSGDATRDRRVYGKVFKDQDIRSVILGERPKDLKEVLKISDELESVVGPWDEENSFDYIDDSTVYIPFTVNGIEDTGKERLDFVSTVTALGVVVQNLSLEDMVLNESNYESWTPTFKKYVRFIDDYRERFEFLKSRNTTSTAKAVKAFKKNEPKILVYDKEINITFEKWNGPSYFILRSEKTIKGMTNGSYEKIEDDAYLIKASAEDVRISLGPRKNIKARR